jgi:hypothetical protein
VTRLVVEVATESGQGEYRDTRYNLRLGLGLGDSQQPRIRPSTDDERWDRHRCGARHRVSGCADFTVVYHDATKQAPQVWITFEVDKPQELFLQIGVPVLDRLRQYRPALALLGPGLPDVRVPSSFRRAWAAWSSIPATWKKPEDFYEPFTGTRSWILKEQNVKLPDAGRYYVVAYDPDGKSGKLWAALGRKGVGCQGHAEDAQDHHRGASVSRSCGDEPGRFTAADQRVIFDFDARDSSGEWNSVNDDVMGGVSTGGFRISEQGMLEFKGVVSLENNGGFASVRSGTAKYDLSDFEGLLIRVRGDGHRYACNLRTDFEIMAGSYQQRFETKKEEWSEIALPFHDFIATSFGQVMQDAPKLNPEKIRSFGLPSRTSRPVRSSWK